MISPSSTVPSDRRELKLLVQNLTDADLAKAAAFLRIGRERLKFDWKIVYSGELDVLMLGSDEAQTVRGMVDDPVATLRVVDAHAAGAETSSHLVRPLEYERFIEMLSGVERRVAATPAAAPAATPVSSKPSLNTTPPAPAPPPAVVLPPAARFRLRRWPPLALLQGYRYHPRLASFLSARHLDLDELARLSNVGKEECQEFLLALMKGEVLDVELAGARRPEPPPTPPPVSTAGTTSPRRPVSSSPAIDRGLLSKIRLSLGLTWRR
ncbi:MAG: hypothetical protein JF606_18355 [Burkholderiales bacterium]|nr:hypothetical protein [Burkholderiales bacterium]